MRMFIDAWREIPNFDRHKDNERCVVLPVLFELPFLTAIPIVIFEWF